MSGGSELIGLAQTPPGRIDSLDLIRGVAVLGILAINIAGFAGPPLAIITPHWAGQAAPADEWAFAASFVLLEGKMRALFTLLFGAGLALFAEGRNTSPVSRDALQLRRLGWLALFGLAHFYALWWGDILFSYAVCGLLALPLRQAPAAVLAVGGIALFLIWHALSAASGLPAIIAEEAVRTGTASPAQASAHAAYSEAMTGQAMRELAVLQASFGERLAYRLSEETLRPLSGLATGIGETFPLILIGMALYRFGFFDGGWRAKSLRRLAWAATAGGLVLTLALLGWAWPRGFPPVAMQEILLAFAAVPHLAMALGYAAMLVLATPALARTALGAGLIAAGRMAFSNYIGTSLVMTAIFCGGWPALAGRFGHASLWPFVAGGWALMLMASGFWLRHFSRGPIEWVWRSLIERRFVARHN